MPHAIQPLLFLHMILDSVYIFFILLILYLKMKILRCQFLFMVPKWRFCLLLIERKISQDINFYKGESAYEIFDSKLRLRYATGRAMKGIALR